MSRRWIPTSASPRSSPTDRKSTRLNSSHGYISYAVFCLKKKKKHTVFTELLNTFITCILSAFMVSRHDLPRTIEILHPHTPGQTLLVLVSLNRRRAVTP